MAANPMNGHARGAWGDGEHVPTRKRRAVPAGARALFFMRDERPGLVLGLTLRSINQTGRRDHVICGVDRSRSDGGVLRQPACKQERRGGSASRPAGGCGRYGRRLVVLSFGPPGVNGFNLSSLFAAVMGSLVFLLIYHALRRI